jgi:AcrR family transcriptional regulator
MASSTKERILDSAERLFSDSGLRMISLRDITKDAGVNLAAVNYHFGSKEALLKAVLERAIYPVNESRITLLDELESQSGEKGPAVEDILHAFLGPPFDAWSKAGDRGLRFFKLLGQIHTQANPEIQTVLLNQFIQVLERYTKALERALPNVDSPEVRRRMLFVNGAMAQAMRFGSNPGGLAPEELDQMRESLIRFAAVGFSAESISDLSLKGRRS